MNSAGTSGYVLNATPAGAVTIYKETNGAFTQIASGTLASFSSKVALHAWRSGNNLNVDTYASGTTEPTPITVADTTYMNGFAGLRLSYPGGGSTFSSVDDLTIGPGTDVAAPLAAAAPTLTAYSPATATLTGTAATGGTAPYTYQWFRSTVSLAVTGTTISGATGVSLSDTGLTPGAAYYYRRVTTDSAGGVITSAQVPVFTPAKTFIVGLIGTSIDSGVGASVVGSTDAGALLGTRLSKALGSQVIVNDQGASGSVSADWLSSSTTQETGSNLGGSNVSGTIINAVQASGGSTSTNVYALAKAAFQSTGVSLIQIMLGANDSKVANAVSASTYLSNVGTLIGQVRADFPGVPIVLIPPPYVVPGSYSGVWNEQSDVLLQGYGTGLSSLVGPGVALGKSAYPLFADNPSELGDGVHPNDLGHSDLTGVWFVSDVQILSPLALPMNSVTLTITHSSAGIPTLSGWTSSQTVAIQRSTDGVSFTQLTIVPAGVLTYTDANRPVGQAVFYRALAQ